MKQFKLHYPIPLVDDTIIDDNVDFYIAFQTGEVYYGFAATPENLRTLLEKKEKPYFWDADLIVRFEGGEVYEATAYTIRYIKVNIHRRGAGYFWAKDMLIVSDLKDKTLQRAVEKSIQEGYFEEIFSKVNGLRMGFGRTFSPVLGTSTMSMEEG